MAGSGELATGRDDQTTFRYEHTDNLHRFHDGTAGVVTQIEDQSFHSLFTHLGDGVADIAGTLFGDTGEIEISGVGCFIDNAIPRHGGCLNLATGDLEGERFLLALTLYAQLKRRARFTAQVLAHFSCCPTFCVLAVDGQDDVTCPHTSLLCRTTLVGLFDGCTVLFLVLTDQGSDAGVAARCHGLQVFLIIVGEIHSIRIYLAEHPADGPTYGRVG